MDTVDAIERAVARTAAVLDAVTPADRARPTPCAEWDVAALSAHVVGAVHAFAVVLTGGPTPAPARVPPAEVTATRLRADGARVVAAWRDPAMMGADYDGVIELDAGVVIPPIALPGAMLAAINLLDVGVHLHDLAGAIGRPELAADDALALATLDAARTILQPGIRELVGFGPERAAPAGAGPAEQLLAFVGR